MADLKRGSVSANGIRFHYLEMRDGEMGDGPLVLCMHGFPDSAHSFDFLLPELAAAGFRAVAPFMRGYSPTEPPQDGRYQTALLSQDVVGVGGGPGLPAGRPGGPRLGSPGGPRSSGPGAGEDYPPGDPGVSPPRSRREKKLQLPQRVLARLLLPAGRRRGNCGPRRLRLHRGVVAGRLPRVGHTKGVLWRR